MDPEMSRKHKELATDAAAEYWIDTNAITRTTTKVRQIRWTIENVLHLPLDNEITGPTFYLTEACLCRILFKKSLTNLYIYLENLSEKTIKIECHLVLLDCEGLELHQEKMGMALFEGIECINILDYVYHKKRFNSLKDDILIIVCCVIVQGYVTKEINSSKPGKEFQDHLIHDLERLFNNPTDSNFTIRVQNEIINAHKNILRSRSAYFKKMFETETKESVEHSVSVTDVSYPTMQKLVEFLYTGDFTGTAGDYIEDVFDLYFAADKYEVMDLRALCANQIIYSATIDSIFEILTLAYDHKDEDLKEKAMDFISFHFGEIKITNAWETFISHEKVLAPEVLNFCFKKLKLIP